MKKVKDLIVLFRQGLVCPRHSHNFMCIILLLMMFLGENVSAWGENIEICSANLSSVTSSNRGAGNASATNCTITWSGINSVSQAGTDGNTYWKFDSSTYVILKLTSGDFAVGDIVKVLMTSNENNKSLAYKLKATNGNGPSVVNCATAGTPTEVSYTLTSADIDNDGSIKFYRNSAADRFYSFSVFREQVADIGTTSSEWYSATSSKQEIKSGESFQFTFTNTSADDILTNKYYTWCLLGKIGEGSDILGTRPIGCQYFGLDSNPLPTLKFEGNGANEEAYYNLLKSGSPTTVTASYHDGKIYVSAVNVDNTNNRKYTLLYTSNTINDNSDVNLYFTIDHACLSNYHVNKLTTRVEGVTLNKTSVDLIKGGSSEGLTANIAAGASYGDILWTSDNAAIATVDANGIVSPVGTGTATITATTLDGLYTASCNVTVTNVLNSISIKTKPTKTTYDEGDNFAPSGLVITKHMSDGTTEDVEYNSHAGDFTFAPSTALTTADHTVTITYGGKNTELDITVNAATGGVAGTVSDLVAYNIGATFIADDITTNGTTVLTGGNLYAAKHIYSVANNTVANNKGSVSFAGGSHLNSLRLKTGQDRIAIKMAEACRITFYTQSHNERGIILGTTDGAEDLGRQPVSTSEWTIDVPAGVIYISSYNNDFYIAGFTVSATPKYTVTFNGDTLTPTDASITQAAGGASITLPTTDNAEDFDGWYTDVHGTGDFIGNAGESYTPTADVTLYARVKSDCTLSRVAIPNGGTPTLQDGVYLYTIDKPAPGNWIMAKNVSTYNPNATFSVSNNVKGKNSYSTITVTAADGATQKTYYFVYQAPAGWTENFNRDSENYPGDHVQYREGKRTIAKTDMVNIALGNKDVDPRFIIQPYQVEKTNWVHDSSRATIYASNAGDRSFAVLNCMKGQIVTINATQGSEALEIRPTNATLLSIDDQDFKYEVSENGDVVFSIHRYNSINSVTISEAASSANFTYGYTTWTRPTEDEMTITIPAHKGSKAISLTLSDITDGATVAVTSPSSSVYTVATKTLSIIAPAAGSEETTIVTLTKDAVVTTYNIAVKTEQALSKVIFDENTRYSQLIIDNNYANFWANTNTSGINSTSGELDYVPGLVAKAMIEAVNYYKGHTNSVITSAKVKTWYDAVNGYGKNKTIKTNGTAGKSFDDLNAVKLYFTLKELAGSSDANFTDADAVTTSNARIAAALAAVKTANSNYVIGNTYPADMQGGWWHKADYIDQMWCDGQYMGAALLAQLINDADNYDASASAKRVTANDWDLVFKQFDISYRYLWNDNTMLMHHAFAADKGNNSTSHSDTWKMDGDTYHNEGVWGRAAGWYLMGLVDALEQMEKGNYTGANFNTLKTYLNNVASGMKARQDAETGCWYQLPLYDNTFSAAEYNNNNAGESGRVYNYLESSATALVTAAFLKAMRLGYLDKATYEASAKKAYKGFVENFINSTDNKLYWCSRSAGLGGAHKASNCNIEAGKDRFRDGSSAYYLKGYDVVPTRIGDTSNNGTEGKVLGAFIMAAVEYERAYLDAHTVTFDANGHGVAGVPNATQANIGDAITLTGVTPHPDNTFLGWSVNPDATQPDENLFTGWDYTPMDDVTLYAVYRTGSNVIGSEHSGWWQSFTNFIELPAENGSSNNNFKGFTFNNVGGAESFNNWSLVATSNNTGHNGDGVQNDGNNELFVLRGDGNTWGTKKGTTKFYKAGAGNIGADNYGEITAEGNAEFTQAMKNAVVNVNVSRYGKRIFVYATMDCTVPDGDEGEKTEKYVMTYTSGEINADAPTYLSFTTDHSTMEITAMPYGPAYEVKVENIQNGTADVVSAEGISVNTTAVPANSNVTFTATPASGWKFSKWVKGQGGGAPTVSTAANYQTTITETTALSPVFESDACNHVIQDGTIGAEGNTTTWWTVMSHFYELTPGYDRTFTFTSHTFNSSEDGSHLKNWGLVGSTTEAHNGDTPYDGQELYTITGNGTDWSSPSSQVSNKLYLVNGGEKTEITVGDNETYNTFMTDMTGHEAVTNVKVSYKNDNKIYTEGTIAVNGKNYAFSAESNVIADGVPLYFFFSVNKNHLSNFTATEPVSNNVSQYTVNAVDENGTVIQQIITGDYVEGESVLVTYPQIVKKETTIYSVKQNYYGNGDWFHYEFTPSESNSNTLNIPYTDKKVTGVLYYSEAEDIAGFTATTANGNRASMGKAAYTTEAGKTKPVDITQLNAGTYQLFVRGLNGNSATRTATFGIKGGDNIGTIDIPKSNDVRESITFTINAQQTITVDMPGSSASGLDWIYIVESPVLEVTQNNYVVNLNQTTVEGAAYIDAESANLSTATAVDGVAGPFYNTKNTNQYVSINEKNAIAFEVKGFHNNNNDTRTLKIYDNDVLVGTIQVVPGATPSSSGIIPLDNASDVHNIKITGDGKDVYPHSIKFYTEKTNPTLNPTTASLHALETVVLQLDASGDCVITSMTAPTSEANEIVTAEFNTATNELTLTGIKEGNATLYFNITGGGTIFNDADNVPLAVKVSKNVLTLGYKNEMDEDYTQFTVNADKIPGYTFTEPILVATANIGTEKDQPVDLSGLNVSYSSDNLDVATVDDNGKITIIPGANGTAKITATVTKDGVFETATADFLVTILRGLDWKMEDGEYKDKKPGIRDQFVIKDAGEKVILTATFGGWNRNSGNFNVKNPTDYDGSGKKTDTWSDINTQTPAMDGYSKYRSGANDAMNEDMYLSSDVIYGVKRNGWFEAPVAYNYSTKQFEVKGEKQPFTLPVRGAYMTFEPEKNGVLTIYIDQNGAWNQEKNDIKTPDGDLYSVDENGTAIKFPGNAPWQFRPHSFYIVDQDGMPVDMYTDFHVTTQTKVESGLRLNKDIQKNIDDAQATYEKSKSSSDKKKWDALVAQKALLDKFREDYNLEDGAKFKCIIDKDADGYNDVMNIGNWPEFHDYMSEREQKAVHDNWANGTNGAQTIIHLDNGSYLAIDEGMVKYEFYAAAHQTYYIFSNFSKLGFAGCNFVEDKTDGHQPTAVLNLSETESYIKPTVHNGENQITESENNVKQVGNITIPQYETITIDRKFTAGNWNTICLPFTMTEKEVRENFGDETELIIMNSTEVTGTSVTMKFVYHEIQSILAGYPYLIKPSINADQIVVHNKLVDPDLELKTFDCGDFIFTGINGYCTPQPGNTYSVMTNAGDIFLSSNKLYISKGATSLKGYRAYMPLKHGIQARAKSVTLSFMRLWEDEEDEYITTILEGVEADDILEAIGMKTENGVYNLNGQKVSDSLIGVPAGIYIINGKKTVIK